MSLRCRVLTVILCVAAVDAGLAEPQSNRPLSEFDRAQQLFDQTEYDPALRSVDAAYESLPGESRLTTWRFSLRQTEGYPCKRCLIGRKHVYLVVPRPGRIRPGNLQLPDKRPVLNDGNSRYDFNTAITCLDGARGRKLWTRQLAGGFSLELDPRNDDVYCWRNALFRLRAADGETTLKKTLPKDSQVKALIVDGTPLIPRLNDMPKDRLDQRMVTYNVSTDVVANTEIVRMLRMAPDESRLILGSTAQGSRVLTQLTARTLDGEKQWRYQHAGYSANEPFWLDGDVVAMNGFYDTKSEVVRLSGQTGEVRWRFALPRSAYSPGWTSRFPKDWNAVGLIGEHVAAIGGDGTIFFLDPKTGVVASRLLAAKRYMCFPAVIDDSLVICSAGEVRAIPLKPLFHRAEPTARSVLLLRVRCLDRLGRLDEAAAAIEALLNDDPLFAPAWKLRADLNRRQNRRFEEVAARCRYLALTGGTHSPVLRDRWGMIRRIDIKSNISADLQLVSSSYGPQHVLQSQDVLYAGTRNGDLIAIDTASLEVVARRSYPSSFRRLDKSFRLQALFDDRQQSELTSELPGLGQPVGPPEWNTINGYDGLAVAWKGNWYRPLRDGHVRVLADGKVAVHKTELPDIQRWNIVAFPDAVLGYGTGGVYRLDDNLCPVEKLIDAPKSHRSDRILQVTHIAHGAATLGLVIPDYPRTLIQVWSLDGQTKISEAVLNPPVHETNMVSGFRHVDGGYLLTGCETAWVPATTNRVVWRFGVPSKPGYSIPRMDYNNTAFYGRPVVHQNHIFVPCRDGGIYVFDQAFVTGRSVDQPPATAHP